MPGFSGCGWRVVVSNLNSQHKKLAEREGGSTWGLERGVWILAKPRAAVRFIPVYMAARFPSASFYLSASPKFFSRFARFLHSASIFISIFISISIPRCLVHRPRSKHPTGLKLSRNREVGKKRNAVDGPPPNTMNFVKNISIHPSFFANFISRTIFKWISNTMDKSIFCSEQTTKIRIQFLPTRISQETLPSLYHSQLSCDHLAFEPIIGKESTRVKVLLNINQSRD